MKTKVIKSNKTKSNMKSNKMIDKKSTLLIGKN